MTALTHLCLGVGGCCECDPRELVILQLRVQDRTPDDALRHVREVLDATPGVVVDRPMEAQQSFLGDDVEVTAVLRIVDRRRLPEEKHVDPEDGPSITGAILESVMEHVDTDAGSAGWLVER